MVHPHCCDWGCSVPVQGVRPAGLARQGWTHGFRASTASIHKVAIWIRFSRIAYNYYHDYLLLELAKAARRPLKVDHSTQTTQRGKFARFAVEVEFFKPLVSSGSAERELIRRRDRTLMVRQGYEMEKFWSQKTWFVDDSSEETPLEREGGCATESVRSKTSAPKSAAKSSQDLRGNRFNVLVSLEGDQFSNKEGEFRTSKNPWMVFSSQGSRVGNRKSNKGKSKEGETLSMM
ncbi:hypothetical protein Scep_023505 [Stephania cephalantha]|uniref:DUF4283 domain-containing protein n=1 Tax=Stephania cephalantha TaxID=152367 RepID=A0AAP0EUU2_9MAGN